MRYDEQVRAELQGRYDALTDRIAAIDRELAAALDEERRLVLNEKRRDVEQQRRVIVRQMQMPADADLLPIADKREPGRSVEYDELTKMLYEIKTDVAILRRQLEDHVGRCRETTGYSPQFLTVLAIAGIVSLLVLVFMVAKVGMP